MQKIPFENLPSTNYPLNASNLNQAQENMEASFKNTYGASQRDGYNQVYINNLADGFNSKLDRFDLRNNPKKLIVNIPNNTVSFNDLMTYLRDTIQPTLTEKTIVEGIFQYNGAHYFHGYLYAAGEGYGAVMKFNAWGNIAYDIMKNGVITSYTITKS